jgi:hypothetical protein
LYSSTLLVEKVRREPPFAGLFALAFVSERPRSDHVQRVIDQALDPFHKAQCVWQLRVLVECGFILAARMDVKQPRIPDGNKGLD